MKQESDILDKIGTDPGFKVPDGYFDNFKKQMSEALPERKFEPEAAPSKWLRIRPCIYGCYVCGRLVYDTDFC